MSRLNPRDISGVVVREYGKYEDDRGAGIQLFDAGEIRTDVGASFAVGSASVLVNKKGTLRGFHVQPGAGRSKYVCSLAGAVFDALVDLRPGSSTFGHWAGIELSADNRMAVLVPPGVGHAFLGLSNESVVSILTTATSTDLREVGVDPFDRHIGVDWPVVGKLIRSPRDVGFASFDEFRKR